MAQPLEYEQVTYNAPDGAQYGRVSTEAIAFYGATPVARTSLTGTVTASTYGTTTNTTAVFGFDSAAAVTSLIHNVSTMVQWFKTLGLIT